MSISSMSNEEIRKLKTSVAEVSKKKKNKKKKHLWSPTTIHKVMFAIPTAPQKDDEINTLKKELEALRKQESIGNSLQRKSTTEQVR